MNDLRHEIDLRLPNLTFFQVIQGCINIFEPNLYKPFIEKAKRDVK